MATPRGRLVNVRDTARRLGVHENTVRNWSNRGLLRPVPRPLSQYRRFDSKQVARFAREMRNAAAPLDKTQLPRPERGRVIARDHRD